MVDVAPFVEQQLDDLDVAVLGGSVEGCGSALREGQIEDKKDMAGEKGMGLQWADDNLKSDESGQMRSSKLFRPSPHRVYIYIYIYINIYRMDNLSSPSGHNDHSGTSPD